MCALLVATCALAGTATAQSADALTVANVVIEPGATSVRVPVYLQDVLGTPLGRDQDLRHRISDFAFSVVYGPNPCIDTVAPYFDTSKGVLADVNPFFEGRFREPHEHQAFVWAVNDDDVQIPFTDAAAPGDLLGELVFQFSDCMWPIYLVLDQANTTLVSHDNTTENEQNGTLILNHGSIAPAGVTVPTPDVTKAPTVPPTLPWTATPTTTPTWDPSLPTYTPTSTPTRTPTRTATRTPTVTPTYDPRFPTPTPYYETSGGPSPGTGSPPPPMDVIAIPNMKLSLRATFVRLPVYVQDVQGSLLGRGFGDWPGRTITGFEIDVKYGPNSCIDTVAPYFDTSEGILAGLSPDRVERPRVSHVSQGFVYHVDENAGLIPFYSDYPPGDKIGDLVFALSGCTSPIYLDIQAGTTRLRGTQDEDTETVSTKTLDLWSGSFGFGSLAPARTPGAPGAETPTATPTPDRSPRSGIGDPVPIPAARPAGLALLGSALAAAGLVLARRLRG